MDNTGIGEEKVLSVSFNPDNTFMAAATTIGFRIYTMQPFHLKHRRDFGTPLRIVELINHSNLMGLVGEKQTPFAPPNRLAIFDDKAQKIIAEATFGANILQVRIRQNKIAVAVRDKVYLLDLFSMQIEHIIYTFKFEDTEPYSLVSMSNDYTNFIMAAPGTDNGSLLLVYLSRLTQRKIRAHQSILSAVVVTQNGEKVATASQKGIQVRVFDTKTGSMLQEVRRGNQFATIYSLAFSREGNWLAVSSDSCNLHIFVVHPTPTEKENHYAQNEKGKQLANPRSLFYALKGIFPYFDAEYSFCTYKYQNYDPEMRTWLAFGHLDDHLVSVSNQQIYEQIKLNQKGGKCRLIKMQSKFMTESEHHLAFK